MRVYISGPMTNIPQFNFPAFNEAAELLERAGWEVENPADKGIIPGWNWIDYLRYDIEKMMACNAILRLPGWEDSNGAKLETHIAEALNFTFIDYELLDVCRNLR